MELRLDGRVALVTGGSRGIGRAIAAAFATAGASVMICSRKAESLEATATSIGNRVAWQVANAGDPEAAETTVKATIERFGSLDILVNNAGTNPFYGPLMDISTQQMDKTSQVNQRAIITWTQWAWRASMRSRGGCVINMASIGGHSVEPNVGYYAVTKAAVIHLTRQLAAELAPGVRVNAIAPGFVKTDFSRSFWDGREKALAQRTALKRLGEPEDVAAAALFLASDAAKWITGTTLIVDGGELLATPHEPSSGHRQN